MYFYFNWVKFIRLILLLTFSAVLYPINAESFGTLEKSVFQLHLLKKPWFKYMSYLDDTPEKVLAKLKPIDLSSESLFSMTDNEIESYNWPDQSMVLTIDASLQFLTLLGIRNRQELIKLSEFITYSGLELSSGGVFLIRFRNEILYGGAVDNKISTKGYQVPTLFIQIAAIYGTQPPKIQLRFVIRPLKTIQAILTGYQALDESLKNRIEIPEVHDFFKHIGKITYDETP